MTDSTMPITSVVVMEDRAQVERQGVIPISGVTRVEVGPVADVAVDRSLDVVAEGASVLDARIVRRRRETPPGGLAVDATALQRELHEAERALVSLADARMAAQTWVDALAAARVEVLRDIAEAVGAGKAEAARWSASLDELGARELEADARMRQAHVAHAEGERRVAQARAALVQAEPPVPELETMIVIALQGEGEAKVRATYHVPCAAWRPAYRARLGDGKVVVDAEAVIWQHTQERWANVRVQLSTARPTLGTTPPHLHEDRLTTRPKQEIEKRSVDVAVREVTIETTGEGGSDGLPGVDDGGEVRVLEVAQPLDIVGDGSPHRVRLFGFEAPARVACVARPELGPAAYVMARFDNASDRALLAGPVELARTSGSVGRGTLPFTAPGGALKLSFGAEDGVSVLRDVEVERDTSRLTGRQQQRHTITLHVSNASAVARTIEIEERVIVSEVKEVEVEVDTKACRPAPREVDRDGIARLELALPADGTATAKLVWELVASGKVTGI
jgi:hypothetical protein